VITPALAARVFELIREEVEVTPFTIEVSSLTALVREFEFTKLAVVVEITPFTFEVKVKLLVVVDTVRTLTVPDAKTALRLVVATTPFTIDESSVPVKDNTFAVITDVVPTEPPRFEVRVLPEFVRVLEVFKLFVMTDPELTLVKLELLEAAPLYCAPAV
jgi:hypothetical protein